MVPSIGSMTQSRGSVPVPPPSSPRKASLGKGLAELGADQVLDRPVGDADQVLPPLVLDGQLVAPVEIVAGEAAGRG